MRTSQKLTQLLIIAAFLIVAGTTSQAQTTIPAPGASDQQAGWMIVYPYYTSNTFNQLEDTSITISNASTTVSVGVHMFFLDGRSCSQADWFLCLTPSASLNFKASEIDPDNTGYIVVQAVQQTGPNAGAPATGTNLLTGNAFLSIPSRNIYGNYGAVAFSSATRGGIPASFVADPSGTFGTVSFYAPNKFFVEVQSPADIPGQTVLLAGLSGDISTGLTGAGQVGIGSIYNGNERPYGSFSNWIPQGCLTSAVLTTSSPRVPISMAALVPTGQVATITFNVTAAVGLIMTPVNRRMRYGVRGLHAIGIALTNMVVPMYAISC